MAISVSEPTAEVASTSNASTYALGSFTPTAGAFLVLWVFASGTTAAGSVTNTGTTLTWTKQGSVSIGALYTMYCFTAQVPASTSASVITFDCTGDAATGAILMIQSITGHNFTNPVKQFTTGIDSSAFGVTTLAISFASTRSGNACLVGAGWDDTAMLNSNGIWNQTSSATYSTPTTRALALYLTNLNAQTAEVWSISTSVNYVIGFLEVHELGFGYSPTNQFYIHG